MKNILIGRIIILVSIALIISSILISFVGVSLSEGLIKDIISHEFIPDMAVLSRCTIEYQKGNITKDIYERILGDAAQQNASISYTICDSKKEIIYNSKSDNEMNEHINMLFDEVFNRGKLFHIEMNPILKPSILVGVPLKNRDEVIGVIFVTLNMLEIVSFRIRFLNSLFLSILIVLPIILFLTYIFLRRLTRPLKSIGKVALAMVKGDFSVRADESMVGEVGLLGKTLNKLSVELYKNISALFLEKDRLTQVLNSLDEGMIAVDKNKIITHANPAFIDMFGVYDNVNGLNIDTLTPFENAKNELSQAIEEKCTIVKNINHGAIIMRMIIAPIRNDKDESAGAVILFRDITVGERLEDMRRNYVSNVSHELRSPLTSIRGLIEPIKDNMVKNEADKQRYYDIIYQETMRLSRLIDDIMELSRLQTSESFIKKSYFNLNDLMDILYERYKVFNEVDLIFDIGTLPNVFSNSDRIEQVMVILLDNAFKFTPKGGKIVVNIKLLNHFVEVSLKDTGCGIADEDLPYIFDRFYKSDKSRTKKGAGLGLSILKEILYSMGEAVSVKSKLGEGCEFIFTIGIKDNSKVHNCSK